MDSSIVATIGFTTVAIIVALILYFRASRSK
jgi:hypothetical protein